MGLAENVAVFREISKNHHLLPKLAVVKSPANLDFVELDDLLTPVRETLRDRRRQNFAEIIENARGNDSYTDHLEEVVQAAVAGRIAILLSKPAHGFMHVLKAPKLNAIPIQCTAR